MAENGNRQWTIWIGGLLATTILSILLFISKGVVANNEKSIDRDDKLTIRATSNETRVVRLEECQVAIKDQLIEIKMQAIKQTDKLDKILSEMRKK